MFCELTRTENRLLTELVEKRLRELSPEIRRSRSLTAKKEFRQSRDRLNLLLHKLRETDFDVCA